MFSTLHLTPPFHGKHQFPIKPPLISNTIGKFENKVLFGFDFGQGDGIMNRQ